MIHYKAISQENEKIASKDGKVIFHASILSAKHTKKNIEIYHLGIRINKEIDYGSKRSHYYFFEKAKKFANAYKM